MEDGMKLPPELVSTVLYVALVQYVFFVTTVSVLVSMVSELDSLISVRVRVSVVFVFVSCTCFCGSCTLLYGICTCFNDICTVLDWLLVSVWYLYVFLWYLYLFYGICTCSMVSELGGDLLFPRFLKLLPVWSKWIRYILLPILYHVATDVDVPVQSRVIYVPTMKKAPLLCFCRICICFYCTICACFYGICTFLAYPVLVFSYGHGIGIGLFRSIDWQCKLCISGWSWLDYRKRRDLCVACM